MTPIFPNFPLFGAEGEDDDVDTDTGDTDSESQEDDRTGSSTHGGKDELIPRAAAEKARREAANLRKRLNEAEAKLADYTKRDMSDLEQALASAEESKQQADTATRRLHDALFELAVVRDAADLKFRDAADAVNLIDRDLISLSDSGAPEPKEVRSALKRLVDKKPYLLATATAGDGEGGRGDNTSPDPDVTKAREEAIRREYESKGLVPIT